MKVKKNNIKKRKMVIRQKKYKGFWIGFSIKDRDMFGDYIKDETENYI